LHALVSFLHMRLDTTMTSSQGGRPVFTNQRRAFAAPGLRVRACSAAALLLTTFAAPISAQPQNDGTWSPVGPCPLIAGPAAITPEGRVRPYGTATGGRQTG